jgi:uncharacterized membrane protein
MKRFSLLPVLYLAFTLPLLLSLALVTPLWQNPDEPLHMARIVQIAHGGLFGWRDWGTTGGVSDPAIYESYRPVQHAAMRPAERLTRQDLRAAEAVRWSRQTTYTSFPNTIQYPPVFYLPAAAAYWVGRAGGMHIGRTLLLARLANGALFAAMGAFALARARRTRPFLAALLLLPTSLCLACAAGQDCFLIAGTAVVVALLDRIIAEHRAATRAETLVTAGLLVCIAAARPPYAGFLPALLLLKPKPDRALYRLMAASAALVLAWCIAVAVFVSVRLGGADLGRQLAFLHDNPGQIMPIIVRTFRHLTLEYWRQLVGVLGWTDTPIPNPAIAAETLVLALAAFACAGPTRLRRMPLAGSVFAVAAIFILQYLTWSWPGQDEITGVLGRYFVPVALMLALVLPARRIPYFRKAAWAAIALVAATTPAVMIHTEILRYYLP